jgi:CRP-like cAMP-binding protein
MRNAVYYTANKNYIWTDKQKIFEELPATIKCEIALEMYFGVIKRIRFFDDKDNNLIGSIVPLLTPFKAVKYEYIYKKNSHPHAIYFITKGRVSFYLQRKGLAFKDMIEGGYFGDMDIIFQRKRRYTMISTVDSDFLIMTKQILEDIIVKEYPEVYEEMQLVALERDRRVKAAKQIALLEYNEMVD